MTLDPAAPTLNEQVVRRIRIEMAAQRVSQAAVAQSLGHNQTYVSYRLTGKTSLTLDEVEEFADALAIPVYQLLYDESPAQRHRRAS